MSSLNIQHTATEINRSFAHFAKLVQLNTVLRHVNIQKSRGVQVSRLFEWLLGTIFARMSLFRADASAGFTKRTARNCLNDGHINWQGLVIRVALNLIQYVAHFTDATRRQALIIDDSLFKREFSKKTELLARVFDHDNQQFYRGFRTLTLGWSDGNTFLPLNFALMSSAKPKNVLGTTKAIDNRSLAGKRRAQACRKMNDVAVELVDDALAAGAKAQYVLFDSWFASPSMFFKLLQRNLFGVGMIKRTDKMYFRYRKREMSVKTLYSILRKSKWPQHKNYIHSPIVEYTVNGEIMRMKLVFVTNRNNKGKYLVLATTKLSLRPEEVIQLYARRWQIEGYFKVAKQYLQFEQTQIQNYDGLCGHMAMVMLSYDILALAQREAVDERTLGDLFYDYGRRLPDIQVADAISKLMKLLIGLGRRGIIEAEILNDIFDEFIQSLPNNLVTLLGGSV